MPQRNHIEKKIASMAGDGDILLMVPPYRSLHDICLGPHILQETARAKGYDVSILYLNILLASVIGVDTYEKIDNAPLHAMLGERMFARSAYDLPPLGKQVESVRDEPRAVGWNKKNVRMFYEKLPFTLEESYRIEEICRAFISEAVSAIMSLNYKIIGCSAQTGQINSSIALIKGIKQQRPHWLTLIGGPCCEGEMAQGIASLSESIDYIFSGESDDTFPGFLDDYAANRLPDRRIVEAKPPRNLDTLPLPDYREFSKQYRDCLGEDAYKHLRVWYETSRGCWWGDKKKCSFCAIPGTYREKSVKKTLADLKEIKTLFPGKIVAVTDNILPATYYNRLLPLLNKERETPLLAYPMRVNPDPAVIMRLKKAGICALLLGIESLSTPLLKRMKKGTDAAQNLLALRNARGAGIYVDWFMLWGFPGDSTGDYRETLRILPLIRHLQPPRKLLHMLLTRFSPYYKNREDNQMSNIRPWAVYESIYPGKAGHAQSAYYYTADYSSGGHDNPGLIQKIQAEIETWQNSWKNSRLELKTFAGKYLLIDDRKPFGGPKEHMLDADRARELMTDGEYLATDIQRWAVEEKFAVVVDGRYIPLATAAPELLLGRLSGKTGPIHAPSPGIDETVCRDESHVRPKEN
ncbi:MAG: RiPP maturation radical SAM protein 1 [bacterium]|nr:RiPP maturation radical SAM protein 1 [bacterium]